MPTISSGYRDRTKERRYWQKYYEDKGCSYNKVLKLVYKKMGYK